MALNYTNIFLQKTGMMDSKNPWSDERVKQFLDQASYKHSISYETPWDDFDLVGERYKFPLTLLAAIEFWWGKVSLYATENDFQAGGGANIGGTVESRFSRALRMIEGLQLELEEMMEIDGSGDVIICDLVKRSKQTGYIVPEDWLS
jgi:hypothetical protein